MAEPARLVFSKQAITGALSHFLKWQMLPESSSYLWPILFTTSPTQDYDSGRGAAERIVSPTHSFVLSPISIALEGKQKQSTAIYGGGVIAHVQ